MAKTSNKSPEEKLRVVLSVLRGEVSAAAAGRRAGVSEQTVHNWKKLFLDAGREGLAQGRRRRSAPPGRCRRGREGLLRGLRGHLRVAAGARAAAPRGPRCVQ